MNLSLFLYGLPLDEYAPIAEAAETAGYEAVWLGDHLVGPEHATTPNPYHRDRAPGLDPRIPIADVWTVLAHAARSTSTIALATGVYVLPLRHALVTARAAASVQHLSGGRLVLGVGTGWLREEFDALGEDFDTRGERTDEILELLPRLWSGEPVAHAGRHISFPAVRIAPGVDRPIPLVGGGSSPAALERAARLCDGWFGPMCELASSAHARRTIEAARARLGRTGTFTCHVRPAEGVDVATIGRYRDAGFGHVVASLDQLTDRRPTCLAERIEALRDAAARFELPARPTSLTGA